MYSIVSIYECPVPVIGALHGKVLGAGLAMASCCDILVATEDAMFGLPEIIVGIVGAGCFLSRILPQQLARYMAYSGEMMTAEQMMKFGALLKKEAAVQRDVKRILCACQIVRFIELLIQVVIPASLYL